MVLPASLRTVNPPAPARSAGLSSINDRSVRVVSLMTALLLAIAPLHAAETEPEQTPAAGKQVAQQLVSKSDKSITLPYLLFLPADYAAAGDKKFPLMLFLHGAGERGDGDLEVVKLHGPPKIVGSKPDFPFIVASPQCPKEQRWTDDRQMTLLKQLLDDLSETYRVDEQRVYLTGLSMGGAGTWTLAAADPDRFAAAVPICSAGTPGDAEKLKEIPIWYFVGGKDRPATVEGSRETVQAIKDAGGNIQFTFYPELGHNCWTVTYDNPELYRWMLQQKTPRNKAAK